jgi:DNA-binding MarR family transcriptional regulator
MEVSSSSAGTLRALRRLVRALRLADRAAEARLGLSAAQLFVLERLSEGPVGSMAELAGRTLTDASSVSVVVQRLTERGLVVRAVAPDDARRTTLRLAAPAKRLLANAPRSPQADLLHSLEQLSASERKELERLLEKVVHGMGIDENAPTPMFFEGEARVVRRRPRTRVPGARARSRG